MYLVVGPLMTVAQILLGHVSAGHQHQVWNFVMNWDKPIVSWVQGQSLCKLALKEVLAWEIWFRSLLFHSRIRTAALIWYSNNRSSQYRSLSPPFIVRPLVVFKVVANMLSVMLCSSHSHWFFRTTSLKYWMMQSWHLMFLEPRRHKKVRERSANFRTLSPLSFEVNFSQLPTRCILTKKNRVTRQMFNKIFAFSLLICTVTADLPPGLYRISSFDANSIRYVVKSGSKVGAPVFPSLSEPSDLHKLMSFFFCTSGWQTC